MGDNKHFCGTATVFHNKNGRMGKMLLAYICRTQALAWIFLKISSGMGSLSTLGSVMATGTKNGDSGMSIPTVLTQQRVFQKYSLFKHCRHHRVSHFIDRRMQRCDGTLAPGGF